MDWRPSQTYPETSELYDGRGELVAWISPARATSDGRYWVMAPRSSDVADVATHWSLAVLELGGVAVASWGPFRWPIETPLERVQAAALATVLAYLAERSPRHRLLGRLRELAALPPAEHHHQEADELVLEYVADPDITAAFLSITRWYA